MRLRLELFVDDLAVAEEFYTGLLGFAVENRQADYTAVRRGDVLFGLGAVAKLPEDDGPGFTRRRLAAEKGAGCEIVLELDDLTQVTALHDRCLAAGVVVEDLRERPWGLWDFRILDPDGYYLRVTHG